MRKEEWTRWTPEEDKILISMCEKGYGYDEIQKKIPGRTGAACGRRARYLRMKQKKANSTQPKRPRKTWTPQEDETLLKMRADCRTFKEIAKVLERSPNSCLCRHNVLKGIVSTGKFYWTAEEDEYILENYGKVKTEQIAKDLGKSAAAVYNRKYVLNIQNGWKPCSHPDMFTGCDRDCWHCPYPDCKAPPSFCEKGLNINQWVEMNDGVKGCSDEDLQKVALTNAVKGCMKSGKN